MSVSSVAIFAFTASFLWVATEATSSVAMDTLIACEEY